VLSGECADFVGDSSLFEDAERLQSQKHLDNRDPSCRLFGAVLC